MTDSRSGGGHRQSDRRAPKAAPAGRVEPPVVGGWAVLAHPLLLAQLAKLTAAAEAERAPARPREASGPNAKLLAHLLDLMFRDVPQNPGDPRYRQGGTLGAELKDWFRAKTGNGRYRLFYRFDSKTRVIVFAWVNDEETLRTYDSPTDAYAVFRRMVLMDKNPPRDWAALVTAAQAAEAIAGTAAARDRRP